MTNDDFLDTLRADWRRQPIDTTGLATRVERRERRIRIAMIGNVAGAILYIIMAVGFIVATLRSDEALFAVAAVAFTLAAPILLFEITEMRRAASVRYADSPTGLLRHARDQAESARRRLVGCRWSIWLLVGSGILAWLLVAAGLAAIGKTLSITSAWFAAASIAWLWQAWRGRRLAGEAARYDTLLAEIAGPAEPSGS